MRRQFSNSAVISTGKPTLVEIQATSWSLSGPPRTLTRSVLRLTKRGTGSPLAVLSLPARTAPAASASRSGATNAARIHRIIGLRRHNVTATCPIDRDAGGTPTRFVRELPSGREILMNHLPVPVSARAVKE